MALMPTGAVPDLLDAEATARPPWHVHGLNRAGSYRAAAAAGTWLPRPARLRLAAVLARRLRPWFASEWDVVLRNVARIAPASSAAARSGMAADVFRHFAMCFSDLVVSNRQCDPGVLVAHHEGEGNFAEAIGAGRGLIVLTAHLGNWDLGGRMAARFSGRATHVVMEAERDPRLERFLRAESAPVRFVTRRRPTDVLGLITALRRGEIVAMQGDRAIGGRSDVAVPFFGAPARFPLGPFALARAARAPVVPAFCVLRRDRRYDMRLLEPITIEPGREVSALARWVAVLERTVREYPEQWFNFFDCWSTSSAA
jgi:lauroyl/myristoyl acyltransferase